MVIVSFKRALRWIGLGFVLCVFICDTSWSDERGLYVRISQIQGEADATEAHLEELKSEFKVLQKKKRTADSRISELARDVEALSQRLRVLEGERERLTVRVLGAEQHLARTRDDIRSRIKAVYEQSVVGVPPLVLRVAGERNRYELAFYARKIRAHDSQRFAQLSAALTDLQSAQMALEKSYGAEQEARRLSLQTQAEVGRERTRLSELLSEMKKKQAAAKQSLARLQVKAKVLEQLLQNLLQREERLSKTAMPAAEAPLPPSEKLAKKYANQAQDVDLRLSKGLFTKGLKVQQPIGGQVVRGFGKTRVRSFSDIVFSKGIELHVEGVNVVRSIAPGRVAFAGAMPGYEKVVIIDHGARSYSLYGRLESFTVRVGDMISGGSGIGTFSQTEIRSKKPFYFEIRKNGKPIDPTSLVVF